MQNLTGDLKRSTRDRWFMGVCGGIAHHYGWRPSVVRLAAVILSIAIPGPSLVACFLAYVALGIALPKSDSY